MANHPYDRVVINTRERPLSSDINQAQTEIDLSLRAFSDQLFLGRTSIADERPTVPLSAGFIGAAYKVLPNSPAGLTVLLTPGIGYFYDPTIATAIGGVPNVDDFARVKPMPLGYNTSPPIPSTTQLVVPVPDPTNPRIDIIEVKPNRRLTDTATRDILNAGTGVFDPTSVFKTLAWDMETSIGSVTTPTNSTAAIGYKAGTPAAVPAAPPTSPGYVKIAEILVGAAVATVTGSVIKDLRKMLFPSNTGRIAARVTMPTAGSPTPTVEVLQAPPGVLVVAVGQSIVNAAVNLYIFAGAAAQVVSEPVSIVSARQAAAVASGVAISSNITVNGGLQTSLAGANANPATAIAVGQPAFQVALTAPGVAGPTAVTYGVITEFPMG